MKMKMPYKTNIKTNGTGTPATAPRPSIGKPGCVSWFVEAFVSTKASPRTIDKVARVLISGLMRIRVTKRPLITPIRAPQRQTRRGSEADW